MTLGKRTSDSLATPLSPGTASRRRKANTMDTSGSHKADAPEERWIAHTRDAILNLKYYDPDNFWRAIAAVVKDESSTVHLRDDQELLHLRQALTNSRSEVEACQRENANLRSELQASQRELEHERERNQDLVAFPILPTDSHTMRHLFSLAIVNAPRSRYEEAWAALKASHLLCLARLFSLPTTDTKKLLWCHPWWTQLQNIPACRESSFIDANTRLLGYSKDQVSELLSRVNLVEQFRDTDYSADTIRALLVDIRLHADFERVSTDVQPAFYILLDGFAEGIDFKKKCATEGIDSVIGVTRSDCRWIAYNIRPKTRSVCTYNSAEGVSINHAEDETSKVCE